MVLGEKINSLIGQTQRIGAFAQKMISLLDVAKTQAMKEFMKPDRSRATKPDTLCATNTEPAQHIDKDLVTGKMDMLAGLWCTPECMCRRVWHQFNKSDSPESLGHK